jgi:c-di-GMP-binding flagellar brake protein YcgR
LQAKILDVSSGGIQVEVAAALRPLVECDVTIPVESGVLRLKAQVKRCRATSFLEDGGDNVRVVYRAGLEFFGLTEREERELIACYGPEPSKDDDIVVDVETAPVELPKRVRRKGPIKIQIDPEFLRKRLEEE